MLEKQLLIITINGAFLLEQHNSKQILKNLLKHEQIDFEASGAFQSLYFILYF